MISSRKNQERGSIVLHFVLFLTVMFIMLAFAIDIGWMYVTKAQLQHAADSSAMASVVELRNDTPDINGIATQYANFHQAGDSSSLDVVNSDISVGYMYDPTDLTAGYTSGTYNNCVEVTLKRNSDVNGALQMFMGFVTGIDEMDVQAKARATYETRVFGFTAPPGETNEAGAPVGTIIPFAVSKEAWNATSTIDEYSCVLTNSQGTGTYTVTGLNYPHKNDIAAPDGIYEVKLYPYENTSGNYGTVDIGLSNNSGRDLFDQIATGINAADLAALGVTVTVGSEDYSGLFLSALKDGTIISTNENEPNMFSGDTGLTAGMQNPLQGKGNYSVSQIGVPRIFLLYETVNHPGENAEYKIVGYEMGVICYVELNGNDKHITVQKMDIGVAGSNVSGTGVFLPSAPTSGSLWMYALTK